MIHTITFNPGIDVTLRLDELRTGMVLRPSDVTEQAGGKGMNVSVALSRLQVPSKAWVLVGGPRGEKWKSLTESFEFEIETIELPGETRQNIKIFEMDHERQTDLNLMGPPFDRESFNRLLSGLTRDVKQNDFVVVAGSALPNTPAEVWTRLGKILRANDGYLVVDSSGSVLEYMAECKPWMVKINLDEFNTWKKRSYPDLDAVVEGDENLELPHHLLLTDGNRGALGISSEGTYERVRSIPVNVQGTVGAGDAFTAGFLAAWQEQQYGWRNALAWGNATAAGAVELPGTDFPSRERVLQILTHLEESDSD